jgi:hypothetical protein
VNRPAKGKRRKGWPPWQDTRPPWLSDDRFGRAAVKDVALRSLPDMMRRNPADSRKHASMLENLLKIRDEDLERWQRRLDAERIAERVANIKAHRGGPKATEQAWQIVALELGYAAADKPDSEAPAEGKALRRWVERNRR